MQLFGITPITFGTIEITVKCTENGLSLCILLKHVKKYGRLFIGCPRLCPGIIIDKQSRSDSPKIYVVDVNDWSQSLNKYTTQWSLHPTTKMYYSVLFRNVSFCLSDRQILKLTNFIFHLSGVIASLERSFSALRRINPFRVRRNWAISYSCQHSRTWFLSCSKSPTSMILLLKNSHQPA